MQKWEKFSAEELKEIFENSKSYKEIAQKLNYNYCGKSLKIIKKIALDYNFSLKLETKTKKQKELEKNAMIGRTFGRLTVLDFDKEKIEKTNKTYFICQCSCNNKITSVRMDGLLDKNNPILSCGCLQKEKAAQQGRRNRKDLEGARFGKLTVIKYDEEESKRRGKACWLCKCDCGGQVIAFSSALRKGQSSCGCLKSKGEFLLKKILQELDIFFEEQKTFSGLVGNVNPLKFDFYLPEKRICIEYQGEQHYFPIKYFGGEEKFLIQQSYDKLKEQYCQENNIILIKIPYWDYNKINQNYLLNLINN